MDLALMMLMEEEVDEEDQAIVNLLLNPREVRRPFNLDEMDDDRCVLNFRFSKEEVRVLAHFLLPEVIRTENRCKATGIFCMCLVLRRMVYPNRYCDLEYMFGRHRSGLSLLFNASIQYIFEHHAERLRYFDQPWFVNNLDRFAEAVVEKGGALPNCVGFIDGTVRFICRPTHNEAAVFNGHKRKHALKYLSITVPNGLTAYIDGPIEGRRHDAYMLRDVNTLEKFRRVGNGEYCLYGDHAFPLSPHLMTAYPGQNLPAQQQNFNRSMNPCRQAVEWGFGKTTSLFAFNTYSNNLKVEKSPVGAYYLVATLLSNCHTCCYGSQTTLFFQVAPPTLEEYLRDLHAPQAIN